MQKPEISIILNSWNPTRAHLHMTMACLAEIRRFTDPEYEIIVVDNTPDLKIRDDYHVLEPYTLIQNTKNHTVYESYNQGADVARGDKLMFIQSDVFVHDRTVNKLAVYLDKYDMAFPQQIPLTRETTLEIMNTPDGQEAIGGWRDAGLLAITREAFDKAGGWDGRFRNILGEKAFYIRCADANLTWTPQTNALISHVMAGNNLTKDSALYNEEMAFDAELMRKEYDSNH